MTKCFLIIALMLNSCGSGGSGAEIKQDTVDHTKDRQSQTGVTLKKEIVDNNFLSFWNEFIDVVKSKDQRAFRVMSFDSLECEGKNVHVNTFMKSYFSKVFDESLFKALSDANKLDFIASEIDTEYLSPLIRKQIKEGKCIEKIVNIKTINNYPPVIIIFKFIETKNGYKLHGYDRVG